MVTSPNVGGVSSAVDGYTVTNRNIIHSCCKDKGTCIKFQDVTMNNITAALKSNSLGTNSSNKKCNNNIDVNSSTTSSSNNNNNNDDTTTNFTSSITTDNYSNNNNNNNNENSNTNAAATDEAKVSASHMRRQRRVGRNTSHLPTINNTALDKTTNSTNRTNNEATDRQIPTTNVTKFPTLFNSYNKGGNSKNIIARARVPSYKTTSFTSDNIGNKVGGAVETGMETTSSLDRAMIQRENFFAKTTSTRGYKYHDIDNTRRSSSYDINDTRSLHSRNISDTRVSLSGNNNDMKLTSAKSANDTNGSAVSNINTNGLNGFLGGYEHLPKAAELPLPFQQSLTVPLRSARSAVSRESTYQLTFGAENSISDRSIPRTRKVSIPKDNTESEKSQLASAPVKVSKEGPRKVHLGNVIKPDGTLVILQPNTNKGKLATQKSTLPDLPPNNHVAKERGGDAAARKIPIKPNTRLQVQSPSQTRVFDFVKTAPQMYDGALSALLTQGRESRADKSIYLADAASTNSIQALKRAKGVDNNRTSIGRRSSIGWDVLDNHRNFTPAKSDSNFPTVRPHTKKLRGPASKNSIESNLLRGESDPRMGISDTDTELLSHMKVNIFTRDSGTVDDTLDNATAKRLANFTANIQPLPTLSAAMGKKEHHVLRERREFKERRALQKHLSHSTETENTVFLDVFENMRAPFAEECRIAFGKRRIPALRRNPAHIKWPAHHKPQPTPSSTNVPSASTLLASSSTTKVKMAESQPEFGSTTKVKTVGSQHECNARPKRCRIVDPVAWAWRQNERFGSVRMDQHQQGHPRFYPWAPFNEPLVQLTRCWLTQDQVPPHQTPEALGPVIPQATATAVVGIESNHSALELSRSMTKRAMFTATEVEGSKGTDPMTSGIKKSRTNEAGRMPLISKSSTFFNLFK